MGIDNSNLKPCVGRLVSFAGHEVPIIGIISLLLTLGTWPKAATEMVEFLVIDMPSAYNGILGRTSQASFGAIPSIKHQVMKFPTEAGIGEVRSDQSASRNCYLTSMKNKGLAESLPIDFLDIRGDLAQKRPSPAEAVTKIPLQNGEGRFLQIGSHLEDPLRNNLIKFLVENLDVFAWSPSDMPGIDPAIIAHRLSINPEYKPVQQKKRNLGIDRQKAAEEEVDKLLEADFIREINYPEWLANVVMVKKNNGKWRMCVDFTDLNEACPKDSFPLPRIDYLVDNASGHQLLSFMDAFSGYNQIMMAEEDREKTAFITESGTYYYRVMPFGLKNAGATYQRLVNKTFKHQIGRNIEVYVDDMLVKSAKEVDHVKDLAETFEVLKKHDMKLNPQKCVFGVTAGKFLGFMVTNRGIEANPDKIQAILDMEEPKTLHDIQKLNGKITALSRFLAKGAERALPFLKLLKGVSSTKRSTRPRPSSGDQNEGKPLKNSKDTS